jgi:hypothetical protein
MVISFTVFSIHTPSKTYFQQKERRKEDRKKGRKTEGKEERRKEKERKKEREKTSCPINLLSICLPVLWLHLLEIKESTNEPLY